MACNNYEKALALAKQAHAGQLDKAGQPYINHLLAVADCFDDEITKTVGILHDIVEDTDYTCDDLTKMGFSVKVVEAVGCLTKCCGEDYQDYLCRVGANNYAREVKIADLKHNMDLSRLDKVTEKDLKRVAKYKAALEYLQNNRQV